MNDHSISGRYAAPRIQRASDIHDIPNFRHSLLPGVNYEVRFIRIQGFLPRVSFVWLPVAVLLNVTIDDE